MIENLLKKNMKSDLATAKNAMMRYGQFQILQPKDIVGIRYADKRMVHIYCFKILKEAAYAKIAAAVLNPVRSIPKQQVKSQQFFIIIKQNCHQKNQFHTHQRCYKTFPWYLMNLNSHSPTHLQAYMIIHTHHRAY